MSAVVERIDVDALVPDGIEPVEGLRAWNVAGGRLLSSVPIVVDAEATARSYIVEDGPARARIHPVLKFAIAANLAGCALNFATHVVHL